MQFFVNKVVTVAFLGILFSNTVLFANESLYLEDFQAFRLNNDQANPGNVLQFPSTSTTRAFYNESSIDVFLGNINSSLKIEVADEYGSQTLPQAATFRTTGAALKVNELNFTSKSPNIAITAGRKKVKWGVGYGFSPTNIVSPSTLANDPDDRLRKIRGSDLLQISLSQEANQFDMCYLPDTGHNRDFIRSQAVAMRYYFFSSPFDTSIVARIEQKGPGSYGANESIVIGDDLELHAEALFQTLQNTLRPSADHTTFEQRTTTGYTLLLGGQWSPVKQTNLVLEYYRVSNGFTPVDWANYQAILANPSTGVGSPTFPYSLLDQITKRQNYVFFRGHQNQIITFSDVSIELEFIVLYGIDDGSSLQRILGNCSWGDSLQVYVQYLFPQGQNSSEFREIVYSDTTSVGLIYYF
jgi:hypothetical protein